MNLDNLVTSHKWLPVEFQGPLACRLCGAGTSCSFDGETFMVEPYPGCLCPTCHAETRVVDVADVTYDNEPAEPDTDYEPCAVCQGYKVDHVHPEARLWVNAYSVDRVWGGPEEGGWWYDAGEPLASVPVLASDRERLVAELARLKAIFADEQDPRGRHSCAGGPDVEVYVQRRQAEAFPTERQRYE